MEILVPPRFLLDHEERDLPTPAYRRKKGGLAIDTDDPSMAELLSDAKHYAEDGCDAPGELRVAARALIAAIAKAKKSRPGSPD